MTIKEQLFEFCKQSIDGRIARIQNNIENIQVALTSEEKSSAGDKHETGRAMLQLEREKLGAQLAEAEKAKRILVKVPVSKNSEHIALGSFVKTGQANYYIAISAGECKIENTSVFCISAATPIGRLLLGKSQGDTISFRNKEIAILNIV